MKDIALTSKELSQLATCPRSGTHKDMYCEKDDVWDQLVGEGYCAYFRIGCVCDMCMREHKDDTRTEWFDSLIEAMEDWNIQLAGELDSEGILRSLVPEVA